VENKVEKDAKTEAEKAQNTALSIVVEEEEGGKCNSGVSTW